MVTPPFSVTMIGINVYWMDWLRVMGIRIFPLVSLWLGEWEESPPAKFRAEEPWYVVWFLAGPALGSDLLFRGTGRFVAISLALVSRQMCSQAGFGPRMTCESSKG